MSNLYDRTRVKKAVIHHLGDSLPAARTIGELTHRANPHGYEFPAYDYGILEDGTIVPMRPLTYVGAHCIADKVKYQYGPNWWNENSIGIVLATDNTRVPPSQAMINSLIRLLTNLCKQQGMTIDDLYPHFQLSATACPGGSYNKLGMDTGFLDYDLVEQAVYKALNPVQQPAKLINSAPTSKPITVELTPDQEPVSAPITDSGSSSVVTTSNKQKKWYTSKTIIVNSLMALGIISQTVTGQNYLTPEVQASAVVIINVILRIVTKEEIIWR